MSGGSHTPGPWSVANIRQGPYVVGATNYAVAQMVKLAPEFDVEREANAHLISAAPDLLEALKGLLRDLGDDDGESYQVARAAIAKALGLLDEGGR